jgi:hypothetical protein
MRCILAVVVPLAAVMFSSSSCSTTTTGTGTSCAARAGNYALTQTRKTGSCSEFDVEHFAAERCVQAFCFPFVNENAPNTTSQLKDRVKDCEGTVKVSPDNCTAEFNYTCDGTSGNITSFGAIGNVTWSADGKTATGKTEWTFFGPGGATDCKSDYTTSLAKE